MLKEGIAANLYLPVYNHYNEAMFDVCIIIAGGLGTRLWPASTSSRPKQFLSVPRNSAHPGSVKGEGTSFFGDALHRAFSVTGEARDSHVVIIAGKSHINSIVDECAGLSASEKKRLVLIPEPLSKNTAVAIACSLLYIDWISAGSERNVLVLSSDHIIKPLYMFKTDAHAAAAMAQADKLVVFGIPPEGPETRYGYIEAARALTVLPDESIRSRRQYEPEVFSVASFLEKPDTRKARAFLAAKKYYWNSGMFAFSTKFMLNEFRRAAPEVIAPFKKLWAPNELSHQTRKGIRILEGWDNLETAYQKAPSVSFESAIAVKCGALVMVKAGFSWTDVGTWDEYARLVKHTDAEVYGTSGTGDTSGTGSSSRSDGSLGAAESCFVDSDIPVALCGTEDLIIVIRSGKDGGPPVALISKKGETERVKEIVEKIKASGRTDLL